MLAGLADGFGVVAEPGLGVALSLTVGVTVGVVGFTVGGIDAGGLLLLGADGAVLADIVGVGVALPQGNLRRCQPNHLRRPGNRTELL